MLRDEQAGRQYNKAAHRRALMQRIDRANGSIEFKHCNITAVLEELGMKGIDGYKPRPNYQSSLLDAIDRYLERTSTADLMSVPQLVGPELRLVGAPSPSVPNLPIPDAVKRMVRKFDPVERDMRNRELGLAGELAVLEYERRRLGRCGRSDLAERICHVSLEFGDGAGFDIASFEETGTELLIEVKTTKGNARTPFFMSRNERAVAEKAADRYQLYRVHEFGPRPALFMLQPPLDRAVRFSTEIWRAEV
jgi:hypothetical protein